MTTLLWELQRHGKWIGKDTVLLSVSSFFRLVMNWRRPYIKNKVDETSWLTLGILNSVSGLSSASDFLNEIIRKRHYQLPILSENVCKKILLNCVVQAFSESNLAKTLDLNVKSIPLFGTVLALNKKFMSDQADLSEEDPNFDQFITFHNTPVPQAQEAVYKEYLELLKTIEDLDKTGSDWTYKLKTFALPRTDKSILDKGNYLISKAAKSFGFKVDEQLYILQSFPQLIPKE